jgi:hypothetical protein
MIDSILGVAGRLGSSADALAALGALIRIESEDLPVDPEVHAVLRAIGAELLGAEAWRGRSEPPARWCRPWLSS